MSEAVVRHALSEDGDSSSANNIETGVGLPPTVGQTLRAAREARGASLDDVAEILRFSVRQIEYIENDNYAALPGATLVRGFIRGYAKYLQLDPQALLAQLDAAVPPETSDVRPPSRIGAANDNAAAPSLRRLGYAALVALAGLIALYLFIQSDQALTEKQTEPVAVTAPVPSPEVVAAPPQVATATEVTAESVPAETVANAAPSDGSAESPAIVSPAGLQLDFDDLSWVEVRDATNTVVLVGEYSKGTRKQVEGKAPFSLWIGRASVVRASYQGRDLDLRANSREDVARLTVE